MNKRIQELIDQATSSYTAYAGIGSYQVRNFDKEKFAQLIVLECSRVAKLEVKTDRVCDAIENHFGITQ